MEDSHFLSVPVIVSSVTICGTGGVFSVGLSVPKMCTTHLSSVSSATTYSFYYVPTNLNKNVTQGTAASVSVILLAPRHGLGAKGLRTLPQGKYALTVMDRGDTLKYGCTVVCGICGRVTHSSNIESMKLWIWE